jgi:alpha-D-ribose 1-methylphosphonate 5-triphosphate synthase subunit PhnG
MPVRQHLQDLKTQRHERAKTTKVDFLTVAREAGGDDEGDEA